MKMKRILLLLVIGLLSACGSDTTETNEEANNNEQEVQEVEFDDELKYDGFMIENVVAEIEVEELTVSFRWINNTGEDIHFTYIGFMDAMQGDVALEENSGAYDPSNKSNALFKNANGGSHKITLKFELENKEDVELVFGSTHTDKRDRLTVNVE